MDNFVIIEVGSTNTKAYWCHDEIVENIAFKTIEFKNHYKKMQKLDELDKEELYKFIKNIENKNIFVFGTSIFRNLDEESKNSWLDEFKTNTGLDFRIVSSDEENEYTVYGAISKVNYDGDVAVMIGGGGSTELAITNNGNIIKTVNSTFGAMDITDKYPDLKEDYAVSNYDKMIEETKALVKDPQENADVLILAGGDYIYFYEELNYPVMANNLWEDPLEPYMLDIKTMDELDKNFFYEVSLEEVCKKTNNDAWWRGARGMRICVKALVDILKAKYIIPTRISMVYGIKEAIISGKIAK